MGNGWEGKPVQGWLITIPIRTLPNSNILIPVVRKCQMQATSGPCRPSELMRQSPNWIAIDACNIDEGIGLRLHLSCANVSLSHQQPLNHSTGWDYDVKVKALKATSPISELQKKESVQRKDCHLVVVDCNWKWLETSLLPQARLLHVYLVWTSVLFSHLLAQIKSFFQAKCFMWLKW